MSLKCVKKKIGKTQMQTLLAESKRTLRRKNTLLECIDMVLAKDPTTLKLEPHNNPNKLNLKVQELWSICLGVKKWEDRKWRDDGKVEGWIDFNFLIWCFVGVGKVGR